MGGSDLISSNLISVTLVAGAVAVVEAAVEVVPAAPRTLQVDNRRHAPAGDPRWLQNASYVDSHARYCKIEDVI